MITANLRFTQYPLKRPVLHIFTCIHIYALHVNYVEGHAPIAYTNALFSWIITSELYYWIVPYVITVCQFTMESPINIEVIDLFYWKSKDRVLDIYVRYDGQRVMLNQERKKCCLSPVRSLENWISAWTRNVIISRQFAWLATYPSAPQLQRPK